ncbi:MAG: ABC transporter substrate-binding protein [Bacteroidia bacterium]
MSNKISSIIFLLFIPIISLYSCGGGKERRDNTSQNVSVTDSTKYIQIADAGEFLPSWSKENVVVYHVIGEPDDMHPTNGNSAQRSEINIYTQMFLISSDFHRLALRPGIAKSMPIISDDELEYTYELRDEPRWDDGDPVTVEDVIFTFKAVKNPLTNNPHAKPYVENIKEIVVDPNNPRVITIKMKRLYIQNIAFLTDYPILQRKHWDPNNTLSKYTFAQLDDPTLKADTRADLKAWAAEFNHFKFSREPEHINGLGPYKLAKWDAGQAITLERKQNHWTAGSTNPYETSFPERIIFKINKDANSQMLEFKSQALDATTSLGTKPLLDLQSDPNFMQNYHSRFTDTYNYSYIAMNMKPDGIQHKKLFTDKRVRRAMAMLVPVDDINTIVSRGMNKRMVGPVSPLKEEYNSELQLIEYDLEGAKKLLDEAGWVDSDGDGIRDKVIDGKKLQFEFNLNYMTTTVEWKDNAQMVAESMYKAGIKVNLNPLDFAVHYDNAKNHKFDMMLASWAGSSIPEDFTQIWHTSSWVSRGSNWPGFGNAESDALIDSIKYTIDPAKRHPMVKKLQEIIYEEQPYIFMFAAMRRNVIHKRFANANMFFERPGVLLNNLRLLSEDGGASKIAITP